MNVPKVEPILIAYEELNEGEVLFPAEFDALSRTTKGMLLLDWLDQLRAKFKSVEAEP